MMSARQFRTAAIPTLILLAGGTLLVLQLSGGGGRLRAADSSQPPTDPNMMTRVIATHPPVELVDQRDDHTRVWQIVREVETTHPDGSTTVDTVNSYIHEKGSGLCYKDARGSYVPAVAEWRETPNGFVIDRCAYGLCIGKRIGAVGYSVEGHELALRPAYLMVSDGVNEADLAVLNPDVEGFIVDDRPSVVRFPAAFGPGYDLECVADKGGFHQNLIIADCPELPEGFDPEKSAIYLYTEMKLDAYLTASGLQVLVEGEQIDARRADLFTRPSRGGCISFCRPPKAAGGGTHVIHAFDASRVAGSPAAGSAPKRTIAEKRLLKDPSTGAAYVVESLPFSYFRDAALSYPVTWDYAVKDQPISSDETWEPRFTYWVSSSIGVTATLTILPGTTVKLNPSTYIGIVTANGKLIAKGEPYSYITITNAEDDSCGEGLPYPPSGRFDTGFYISSDSSAESVIHYCKFGHGNQGIWIGRSLNHTLEDVPPIAHNIMSDVSVYGISLYFCNTDCHNNLIQGYSSGQITYAGIYCLYAYDCSLTNNTIDYCYYGIRDYGYYYYPVTASDNILTYNVYYGTYADTPYLYYHHNRFYGNGGDASGGTNQGNNYGMGGHPYDPSCPGSGYFIDSDIYEDHLQDQGSRTAASAHLDAEEFSMLAPNLASGTPDNYAWHKMDPCPQDPEETLVDIGYHHNRIDYYLTGDVTISGASASLEILPGTVVLFGGDESACWRYLFVRDGAKLTSVGDPVEEDYILFTRRKSASMSIESPHYTGPMGRLYLKNPHADSRIEFCRFERGSGIVMFRPNGNELGNAVASNRFGLSYKAVHVDSDKPVHFFNNVFYWNYYGYYKRASYATVSNKTFYENDYGCKLLLSYTGAPPYYATLRDDLFTGSASYAIDATVSSCSKFNEHFNAFFDNEHNLRIDGVERQTDWNDVLLTEPPFAFGLRGYMRDWFLQQSGRAVDGGSTSSCDAGLRIYTTEKKHRLPDDGQVDIGYHHPFDDSVVFVDGHNGSDANGDGSYTSPYETIEKGRDVAATTQGKSTVFVYPGPEQNGGAYRAYRYAPNQSLTFDDTTSGSGLSFYGCGAGSCIIESVGAPVDENHPLVTIVNQSDMDLEGFTIRGRENEMAEGWTGNGGGIHCSNVYDIRIAYCTVTENHADYGAGIYMRDSEVNVDHCVICDNRAECGVSGGAVFIEGGYTGRPWPTVANSIISLNGAGYHTSQAEPYVDAGGGIACVQSSPTIENCIIANNAAFLGTPPEHEGRLLYPGGGIYMVSASEEVTIEGSAVVNNQAIKGGGIYTVNSDLDLRDCLIAANQATGNGGGLRCEDSDIRIRGSSMSANSANWGAGIYWSGDGECSLISCLIAANHAYDGTAIVMEPSASVAHPEILNCSIVENSIEETDKGSAIWNKEKEGTLHDPTITNCIFWGNIDPAENQYDLWECRANYSDVQREHGGHEGEGNIQEYPDFWNTAFGGYHLRYDSHRVPSPCISPCIDRGVDIQELEEANDIDGDKRKIDVLPPDEEHPDDMDMGSDEAHPFKVVANIEKSGAPDYTITLTWNSEPGVRYEIYASQEMFRDGMEWEMIDEEEATTDTTSWFDTVVSGDSKRQKFYRIKDVNGSHEGDLSDTVGFVNVPISTNATDEYTLISIPLQTKFEEVNDGVGPMIAERLQGACCPENAHQLLLGHWDESQELFEEKLLWLNDANPPQWVDLEGTPADDLIEPSDAIRLLVRGWDDAPPVITFTGFVPMDVALFVRIREKGLAKLETAWGLSYPIKTTLNDIPFLAFGAIGKPLAEKGDADNMLIWPIGGPDWKKLWLRDDGIWMDDDYDTPASDSLVEVFPGKGFHYKMGQAVAGTVDPMVTRYAVFQRPYGKE